MLKIINTWSISLKRLRCLTVTETSMALHPFILRVHPDLFNKYGEDKAKKNEDSLKQLNEYIHKLHNNEQVKPIFLLFHLRHISPDPNFQNLLLTPVNIKLTSSDVTETIRVILISCGLPLDYLTSIGINPSSSSSSSSSPSSSSSSFSNLNSVFHGTTNYEWSGDWFWQRSGGRRRDQVDQDSYKNYQKSIHTWLEKNSKTARQKVSDIRKKKDEVTKLKSELLRRTGLVDVRWSDGWTMATHGTALRTLLKIHEGLPDPGTLQGRTIIFSNVLGISVEGHVILRQDTVATSWRRVLINISDSDATLKSIPIYERQLSTMLGNMKILPPQNSTCIAENYLEHVMILIKAVRAHKLKTRTNLDGFSDMCISVECTTGAIIMTERGDIMVPTSCPAFLLFEFVHKHAAKARELSTHFKRTQLSDEALVSLCKSMLNVKRLTQDSSITRLQMVTCCKRVIQLIEAHSLTADVANLSLRFGQIYTVNMEGEITIPWNFE